MIAIGTTLLTLSGTIGFGMLVLRILRMERNFGLPLAGGVSFSVGFGMLGWLVFPMGFTGLFSPIAFVALMLIGSLGLIYLVRLPWPKGTPLDVIGWLLVVMLVLVLGLDVIEALTPPADADSAAYHFNFPKQFLEAGEIFFVKRAFDGAVPLLMQMAFIPAFSIGGEQTLLYWSMISGWAPAYLLFVLCRDYMSRNWSLAVSLIYLTVPAVVFTGGTGHVEGRAGIFVLVAAWAISNSLRYKNLNFAVLAGMVVGFYAGAKYLGLFFALAAGLTILAGRGWLMRGLVFSAAAFVAGFQWYTWNAINTGDPFFPVLFQVVGNTGLDWWTRAHDLASKAKYFGVEIAVPQNIFWMIVYPFKATFASLPIFEARRTGFGPYVFMILPIVVLGVWHYRKSIRSHPLMPFVVLAALFYGLWFLWGPSQRIRHLIPILPLLFVCATYAALKFADFNSIKSHLGFAIVATLIVQLAGQLFFDLKFIRYLASGEARNNYLANSVVNFAPVPWINANLKKTDKLLLSERQLFYHLDIPFMFASNVAQGAVKFDPDQTDSARFYNQLRNHNVTHLMIEKVSRAAGAPYRAPYELLNETGCYTVLQTFASKRFASRTLPTKTVSSQSFYDVVRLKNHACLRSHNK